MSINSITKQLSINVPTKHHPDKDINQYNPQDPYHNVRDEKAAQYHSDGMKLQLAILKATPDRITNGTASSRVSKLHSNPDWMARYEYLTAIKENEKAAQESGKPVMPDISTRDGRMTVYKDVVARFYVEGVKSEAAIKALDKLSEYYGDKESMAADRVQVPIESVIAHLIQCELSGRDPLRAELAELAPAVCKVLKLKSVTLESESDAVTHRAKHKEATHSELNTSKQGDLGHDAMHTVCNTGATAQVDSAEGTPSLPVIHDIVPSLDPDDDPQDTTAPGRGETCTSEPAPPPRAISRLYITLSSRI